MYVSGAHWSKVEWKEARSVLQGGYMKFCEDFCYISSLFAVYPDCNTNQEAVSDAN